MSGKKKIALPAADLYLDDIEAIAQEMASIPADQWDGDGPAAALVLIIADEERTLEAARKLGGRATNFRLLLGSNKYFDVSDSTARLYLGHGSDTPAKLRAEIAIREILEFRKNRIRNLFTFNYGSYMLVGFVLFWMVYPLLGYVIMHHMPAGKVSSWTVAGLTLVSGAFILWLPSRILGFHSQLRLSYSHDPRFSSQDKKTLLINLFVAVMSVLLTLFLTKLLGH